MKNEEIISEKEGLELIQIARNVIELRLSKIASFAQLLESQKKSPTQMQGAFISLYKHHHLHGCMGTPWPVKPISETVREMALKSAFEDPRVQPLTEEDLNHFIVEVTTISIPKKITPNEIKIGLHGLIVHDDYASGVLLPHVPLEYGWNVDAFLAGTSVKAGLPLNGWKNCDVYAFETQIFSEK